jgi:hypothetical protein
MNLRLPRTRLLGSVALKEPILSGEILHARRQHIPAGLDGGGDRRNLLVQPEMVRLYGDNSPGNGGLGGAGIQPRKGPSLALFASSSSPIQSLLFRQISASTSSLFQPSRPVLDKVAELHPILNAEFPVNIVAVLLDRIHRDEKATRDLLVAESSQDLVDDLRFPRRDAQRSQNRIQVRLSRLEGPFHGASLEEIGNVEQGWEVEACL